MRLTRTLMMGAFTATLAAQSPATPAAQNGTIGRSPDIRNTVTRFYQRMRAADATGFDEFIAKDPSLLVIGSANEWIAERERLRGVFRLKNEGLEAGADSIAYENGDMGWFIDRPDWVFPDGFRMHTRFTAILHREQGAWKFVHWHLSVGVPDAEAVALQRRLPQR